jgi:hypothetical protein
MKEDVGQDDVRIDAGQGELGGEEGRSDGLQYKCNR